MNERDAKIWNAAIDAAISRYKEGIGAIRSAKVKPIVTIEHKGRATKQDVIWVGQDEV